MLKCSKCELHKEEKEFWKNSSTRRGYSYLCKDCINLHYKGRNRDKYNEWARKYRLKQETKQYEAQFRRNYLQSFNGFVSKIYSNAKSRAKKKNWEFNLTTEWISEKLKEMKCEATGCELTLLKYNEAKFHSNAFNPSIDRKDSQKGYTIDNCRIVCWIYNMAKSDFTDNEVLTMSQNLIKNATRN